jgi:hypothetical protein
VEVVGMGALVEYVARCADRRESTGAFGASYIRVRANRDVMAGRSYLGSNAYPWKEGPDARAQDGIRCSCR